jgi:hypothetical protein
MAETHISEWAARNGLSEQQLSSERNEGGTRALGTDVPAVSRDSLFALPRVQWEEDKSRYVYESWLRAAQRRAGP